ncbi:hypothetical protein LINPERHAP2_LOCUS4581, partial [Linum perenne]
MTQRRSERKGQFESMFSSMVAKYGGGDSSGPEPTDEEFEAARKKLESRKASSKKEKGKGKDQSNSRMIGIAKFSKGLYLLQSD